MLLSAFWLSSQKEEKGGEVKKFFMRIQSHILVWTILIKLLFKYKFDLDKVKSSLIRKIDLLKEENERLNQKILKDKKAMLN